MEQNWSFLLCTHLSTEWWQISKKIIIYHSSYVDPNTCSTTQRTHIAHRTRVPVSRFQQAIKRIQNSGVPWHTWLGGGGWSPDWNKYEMCTRCFQRCVLSWPKEHTHVRTYVCSNNSNKMTLNCSNISSCSHSLAFPWNTGRTLNLRIGGPVNRFFRCCSFFICSFLRHTELLRVSQTVGGCLSRGLWTYIRGDCKISNFVFFAWLMMIEGFMSLKLEELFSKKSSILIDKPFLINRLSNFEIYILIHLHLI